MRELIYISLIVVVTSVVYLLFKAISSYEKRIDDYKDEILCLECREKQLLNENIKLAEEVTYLITLMKKKN